MSNLVANPIQISGSVTSYKTLVAATLGTLFTLKVEKIIWESAPESATMSIGDPASGLVLWARTNSSVAVTDIEEDWTPNVRIWRDFSIDVFPGGTLWIYTR